MEKLEIPDKGVDDIMLKHPINDWLAKKKRRGVICTTVGNPYDGFSEDGMLLVTHIRAVRQSQNAEPPVERDSDRYVKKWLVEEGGAREDSMRWMSFPDESELYLPWTGTRPVRNNFSGPYTYYRFTGDQAIRMMKSGKSRDEWVAEAIANGEVLDRIWPPM